MEKMVSIKVYLVRENSIFLINSTSRTLKDGK